MRANKAIYVLTTLLVSTALNCAAAPFDSSARQVVDMPLSAVQVLRGEMIDMLGNLQRAQALSAEGKFLDAADLVEKTMGQSAMGNHGAGIRPGMFMPPGMRALAQGLHRNASEWANALRTSDRRRAENALATVIGNCSGCHQSFQVRQLP